MALPAQYDSVRDYFKDVLGFLKVYHWVYSAPNTHILVSKVFEQFPAEWVTFLGKVSNEELNDLSLSQVPDHAPDSLKSFYRKIQRLKSPLPKKVATQSFTFPKNSGLSKKKQHEIASLAPLIQEVCAESKCDFIIDVGTGLGYLPRLLYDEYHYRTLAIEGSSEKVELARTTQLKHPESLNSVTYFEHFVTVNSGQSIQEAVNGISFVNACITGLHACADLSVTVLELFTKMESCKSMVIMPCCYHRLQKNDNGFENFPVSDLLKEMLREGFLGVPFLRLACQGSVDGFGGMSEEEHQRRTYGCLFRAILEDVAVSEHYQVRRLKRKSGKLNQADPQVEPFETYLTNLKHTHTLIGGEITDHQFLAKMREKWTRHKGDAYLVEGLAAFQSAIQNICENVVLLDRVTFLKEKGLDCFVVKVTDQGISPRCHALVAVKP